MQRAKGTCGGKALNIFMARTLHPLLSLVADDGHGEDFSGNKKKTKTMNSMKYRQTSRRKQHTMYKAAEDE